MNDDAKPPETLQPRVYAADLRPSKTQRKQEAHDLQAVGRKLAAFSEERLARLNLPEALHTALLDYRSSRSHEGKRRALQYVGKMMRRVDAEPLREALAAEAIGPATDALRLHQAESWRARLVADDAVITAFVAAHPGVDVSSLRRLVRAARADAALAPEARHGRAWRELYRLVRAALNQQPDADEGDEEPDDE